MACQKSISASFIVLAMLILAQSGYGKSGSRNSSSHHGIEV
jgi:hypothetical protein